jgi:hypothetical protein
MIILGKRTHIMIPSFYPSHDVLTRYTEYLTHYDTLRFILHNFFLMIKNNWPIRHIQ